MRDRGEWDEYSVYRLKDYVCSLYISHTLYIHTNLWVLAPFQSWHDCTASYLHVLSCCGRCVHEKKAGWSVFRVRQGYDCRRSGCQIDKQLLCDWQIDSLSPLHPRTYLPHILSHTPTCTHTQSLGGTHWQLPLATTALDIYSVMPSWIWAYNDKRFQKNTVV